MLELRDKEHFITHNLSNSPSSPSIINFTQFAKPQFPYDNMKYQVTPAHAMDCITGEETKSFIMAIIMFHNNLSPEKDNIFITFDSKQICLFLW